MAFQSVGGEEGGEKRVHQIFQRLGSRDIDFRKRERRAVEFLVARMKFVPVTPLPLGFSLYGLLSCLLSPSLPPHPFSHSPEQKRKRLRSFASAPQLRPAIISTCLLLPRRNAYKAKQTIPSTFLLLLLLLRVYSVRGRQARRRDIERSGR